MSDFRFDGSVAEFDYHDVGDRTNTTYMGVFRVKTIVSPMDMIRADRLYRELIGSVNPHMASKETQNFAFALSQLKVRILEAPDFYKNSDLDGSHLDSNILIDIINKSIDAEEEYKKQIDNKLKEMQELLSKRIRNNEIKKEEEIDIEPGTEDLPEIDLDEDEDDKE